MFIGGLSAGGVISLNAAYYKFQSMVNDSYPHVSTLELQDVLGNIEADYYQAPTDLDVFGSPQYRSGILGVMCGWGGTPVPLAYPTYASQKNFFIQGHQYAWDCPPIITFHGKKDDIFPISPGPNPITSNLQWVYFSQPNYSTSNCFEYSGTFTIDNIPSSQDVISASGQNLYRVIKLLNKSGESYVDCDAHHGLDGNVDPMYYKSDYGTGKTNDTGVLTYMAGRTATFFQRILFNVSQGVAENTVFIECLNERKGCETSNADCPSPRPCDIDNDF